MDNNQHHDQARRAEKKESNEEMDNDYRASNLVDVEGGGPTKKKVLRDGQ